MDPVHGGFDARGDFREAEDKTRLLKDTMIRVWGKWKESEGKEMVFLRVNGTLHRHKSFKQHGRFPGLQTVLQRCQLRFGGAGAGGSRVVVLLRIKLHSHTSAQLFLNILMCS